MVRASSAPGLAGFAAASAERERAAEAGFAAVLSPERARTWHRTFTAEPHPAGSERNNELARYVADEWKKQGLEDVIVHRYDVLNTAPREVSLTMVAPVRYEATLLDVRGKIVLVRYSNPYSYRGFKALTAEREGAAGILIYSDPAEDGWKRGPVFPDGPRGPESHVQRGAITYDFIVPGDPLTPGWPSLPGARQVKPEEARSLPKIPGFRSRGRTQSRFSRTWTARRRRRTGRAASRSSIASGASECASGSGRRWTTA